MITITESAQEYLAELLSKQSDALGVRVFINEPGTPRAETCARFAGRGHRGVQVVLEGVGARGANSVLLVGRASSNGTHG